MMWRVVQAASALVFIAAVVIASDGFGTHPLVVNVTDSMPRGVYARTLEPIAVGATVLIPLPDAMIDYVSNWPKWLAWFSRGGLLKPVAAVDGDTICRSDVGIFSVNGHAMGKAATYGPDGIPVPSWSGCRVLGADQIAVFSDRIPDSMDSREFGPVPASTAKTYRLVWKFHD